MLAGREALRQRLTSAIDPEEDFAADLLARAGDQVEQLTAKIVAEAALDGNQIAREVLEHACRVLGWAIAQVITLVSPGVIVVGGGVSLMDQSLFLAPLRREIDRYVFPPQVGTFSILPAGLGELVVVYGRLASRRGCR